LFIVIINDDERIIIVVILMLLRGSKAHTYMKNMRFTIII